MKLKTSIDLKPVTEWADVPIGSASRSSNMREPFVRPLGPTLFNSTSFHLLEFIWINELIRLKLLMNRQLCAAMFESLAHLYYHWFGDSKREIRFPRRPWAAPTLFLDNDVRGKDCQNQVRSVASWSGSRFDSAGQVLGRLIRRREALLLLGHVWPGIRDLFGE